MMPLLGRGRSIASAVIRADRARETGDWAVAARLYRAALDHYPRNAPIWVQYGHALKESGEPAEAETAYRTALAQAPYCADTQVQLGHVLKLLGRHKEAEAAYLRAFAINRGLADPLSGLCGLGNVRSSDETEAVVSALGGAVRCITHAENYGFIGNCNLSARAASGEYLVLLNNDTIVLDNWLDELLAPFGRFRNVGLVGSKLLNADGTLQEAGGIVWRDGSGWNFGRGQDPRRPEFNYVKEVDYASGAAIAVPKPDWDALGGFDERYAPAYFDDSDLAFALRARGLRTLYAPAAQIVHHEGISNGTDVETGIKAHQVTNRQEVVDKWHAVLSAEHGPNGHDAFLARDGSR